MLIAELEPFKDAETWVVYEVTSGDKCFFIYFCRLLEVLSIPELRANPHFDPNRKYIVKVLSRHKMRHEASNESGRVIAARGMPELNKTIRWNRYGAVLCEQTGQVYKNASTAARMLGLNQGRLSMHLGNRAGARTIKGLTFRYAQPTDDLSHMVM